MSSLHDLLTAVGVTLALFGLHAIVRWFNYVKVNRCRRRKLRGLLPNKALQLTGPRLTEIL